MRYQRAAMLEALRPALSSRPRAPADSTEGRVTWGHAWRSALPSVLTLFGLWLPILVVGSVFVEQVFAWPGLGSLTAGAAAARDYPLLMGTAVLATAAVVTGSLVTDVLPCLARSAGPRPSDAVAALPCARSGGGPPAAPGSSPWRCWRCWR